MGAKRPLNGTSKVNTRTDRHTHRRTFRLIESIGPEGRCFANTGLRDNSNYILPLNSLDYLENLQLFSFFFYLLSNHIKGNATDTTKHKIEEKQERKKKILATSATWYLKCNMLQMTYGRRLAFCRTKIMSLAQTDLGVREFWRYMAKFVTHFKIGDTKTRPLETFIFSIPKSVKLWSCNFTNMFMLHSEILSPPNFNAI